MAGRMGAFFKVDPLQLLKCSYLEWAIRLAAFETAVKERNDAIEEANKKNPSNIRH